MTQLRKLKVKGLAARYWDSAVGDMAVLQTAVLLYLDLYVLGDDASIR